MNMSEYLVEFFCKNDDRKVSEAEQAAVDAINARIKLFTDIEENL